MGWVYLPSTQGQLTAAVSEQLTLKKHDGIFDAVKFHVSGQEVNLTGYVASAEEKVAVGTLIAEQVRLHDDQPMRNPVIAVHNRIEVNRELAPQRDDSWLIVTVYGADKRIEGVLKQVAQRTAILQAMETQLPAANDKAKDRGNQVIVNEKAWPAANWDKTLAQVPDFKSLLQGKTDLAARLIAATNCDGEWKVFPADASNAELVAFLAPSRVREKQVALALQDLRSMKSAEEIAKEQAAQLAKANQEKEARAKVEAERIAKEKAVQEAAQAAVAKQMAESAKKPAFVGVAGDAKSVSLFGILPSEEEKAKVYLMAQKAFPGATIDAAPLTLDPARVISAESDLQMTGQEEKKPFVGIFPYGMAGRYFPADVYDSELAAAFPALQLQASDMGGFLQGFRIAQTSAGIIKKDEPYVSLLTDGKTITLTGEVADELSKHAIAEAVRKANPQGEFVDQLQVTPLVNEVKDLAVTLSAPPVFQAGTTGVAIARPGQAWRSAVIHSIYFPTGSDRSKDQERAVAQMQRVRKLLPQAKFEIVGHTDDVGKAAANEKLSLDRANAFVAYATVAGVEAAALSTRGAGPAEPIADNKTDGGKSLNRRVDVMLK